MKNKKEKVNIEELVNIIQEQNKTIKDLKDAIVFIEENCINENKFSVKIACIYDLNSLSYSSTVRKDYLQIQYLKCGKVQTLKYELPEQYCYHSVPEIIETSQDTEDKDTYIVTLKFGEEYRYYMIDMESKNIADVTSLIKSQPNMTTKKKVLH